MTDTSQNQQIRIPNLPTDKLVDENGFASPSEETFRHTLITNLQAFMGNEGLVAPVQTPANLLTIQNNSTIDTATGLPVFTCQLGTILYVQHPTDYTQDKVVIAVRNDNTYPATAPIFKTFTLT